MNFKQWLEAERSAGVRRAQAGPPDRGLIRNLRLGTGSAPFFRDIPGSFDPQDLANRSLWHTLGGIGSSFSSAMQATGADLPSPAPVGPDFFDYAKDTGEYIEFEVAVPREDGVQDKELRERVLLIAKQNPQIQELITNGSIDFRFTRINKIGQSDEAVVFHVKLRKQTGSVSNMLSTMPVNKN